MDEQGRTPSLAELQQSLREAFTGTDPAVWAAHPHIVDEPPISRAARVAIYANGYFWRLLESVSDDYEATGKSITWLKDYETFSDLVRAYFEAHPSQSPDIMVAGRAFPEFVESLDLCRQSPWLGELARFERSYLEAFFAGQSRALPPERLQILAGEEGTQVRLKLAPSLRLVESSWPILGLWRRRLGSMRLYFPKKPRKQWLCIRRRVSGGMRVETLELPAFRLLQSLSRGDTLGVACASIEGLIDDPQKLSHWFQAWVADGVFSELTLAN